ncbi:hypothetical protein Pan110_48210 [Gimesia panareensis]|nr:hypothetical protein Pan110_48210 [Gimesia panareensis]
MYELYIYLFSFKMLFVHNQKHQELKIFSRTSYSNPFVPPNLSINSQFTPTAHMIRTLTIKSIFSATVLMQLNIFSRFIAENFDFAGSIFAVLLEASNYGLTLKPNKRL